MPWFKAGVVDMKIIVFALVKRRMNTTTCWPSVRKYILMDATTMDWLANKPWSKMPKTSIRGQIDSE